MWDTEIISISIGCRPTRAARKALGKAIHNNVIVLAATGNSGDSQVPVFPGNEERVFKLFAASPLAKVEAISGTAVDLRYSFHTLGQDIQSTWPGHLIHRLGPGIRSTCKKKEKLLKIKGPEAVHECSEKCYTYAILSGTSFATPIAASFVAIIYQFYNAYRDEIDPRIRDDAFDLKTIASVRHILTRMSTRAASGMFFLQAPTYRSGSDFFFEPFEPHCAKDPDDGTRPTRRRMPREDDRDEWEDTYEEFFWKRLVQTINDGRRDP